MRLRGTGGRGFHLPLLPREEVPNSTWGRKGLQDFQRRLGVLEAQEEMGVCPQVSGTDNGGPTRWQEQRWAEEEETEERQVERQAPTPPKQRA